MRRCAYCEQPATTKIVSNPDEVCFDHALEFWSGLLAYARDRAHSCVRLERWCGCGSCDDLGAPYRRAMAIAAAGPSPGANERSPIRLAS